MAVLFFQHKDWRTGKWLLYSSLERVCFQEGLESGEIPFWNVDDLVTDIDAVVTIDFLDFVDMNDVRTMDT